MKDSVNTKTDDKDSADQSCEHKSTSLSNKWSVKAVFQYQASNIDNGNYQKNVNKSAQKIVADVLQNAMQPGRFFYKKTSEQCCGKQDVNSNKGNSKCHSLKKSVTCTHPADHPFNYIKINQNIQWCKK